MTDAIDIYRAAKLVIDRHGEDAPLYVAARDYGLAGEATRGACLGSYCSWLPSGRCLKDPALFPGSRTRAAI